MAYACSGQDRLFLPAFGAVRLLPVGVPASDAAAVRSGPVGASDVCVPGRNKKHPVFGTRLKYIY